MSLYDSVLSLESARDSIQDRLKELDNSDNEVIQSHYEKWVKALSLVNEAIELFYYEGVKCML